MDSIDLILRALEAGTAPDVGVQAMAPDDLINGYDELLDAVAARLLGVGAGALLENYMAQPEIWETQLAEALRQADAHTDAELIEAAQSFMSTADLRRTARGGYAVELDDNAEGFV